MAGLTPHDDVRVIVYDLDGVITRKDSFTAFLGERFRRAPLRLLAVVGHEVLVTGALMR